LQERPLLLLQAKVGADINKAGKPFAITSSRPTPVFRSPTAVIGTNRQRRQRQPALAGRCWSL